MKLIQQSAELWEQPEGEIGIYKQIERAARLCYKSEDKVTEDSYKRFIRMLSEKGHNSPLEHGTVYLMHKIKGSRSSATMPLNHYCLNPYSRYKIIEEVEYVTTNYRVLKEHNWEEDLKYLCAPTENHDKRISVHITTSIGISRELNRHRCHSICEESTRYCNYSKDKFGNELTFIVPSWVKANNRNNEGQDAPTESDVFWTKSLEKAESEYLILLRNDWKPQQARDVLPLATKTELIHTAFESDWEEFFKLRCSKAAHPMMQELANQIKDLIRDKIYNIC